MLTTATVEWQSSLTWLFGVSTWRRLRLVGASEIATVRSNGPIINHLRPNQDWNFAVAMKDVHTGGGQTLEDWCSVTVEGQQTFEAARPRQLDNL